MMTPKEIESAIRITRQETRNEMFVPLVREILSKHSGRTVDDLVIVEETKLEGDRTITKYWLEFKYTLTPRIAPATVSPEVENYG